MILYLIKNNFKLMLRNKWIIGMMIIGPIIVIAVLSAVFQDVLRSYEGTEKFTIGYRLAEDSTFRPYIDTLIDIGNEAGITLSECTSGSVKELLDKNDYRSFVEFSNNSIKIYIIEGYEMEGMKTEYFFNKIIKGLSVNVKENDAIVFPVKQLSYIPKVEANDYYGIVFIVYYIWCCYVSISSVIISEKKNRIEKKFRVAPVSEVKLYLAKAIPCVLITLCEMAVTITATVLLFDVQWGNPLITILIIFLMIVAATMFGLFLIYLFNNLAVAIGSAFAFVWIAGYLGGSFETYYYSSVSDKIKVLSPLYHINRALVEYSAIGKSDYTGSSIVYLLIISGICFFAGLIIAKIRKVDIA